MEIQTLSELKDENKESTPVPVEEVKDDAQDQQNEQEGQEESTETEQETEQEAEQNDGVLEEGGEEPEEVEAWLVDQDEKTVPLSDHIQLRQKLKQEKRELQQEVSDLKTQLEPEPAPRVAERRPTLEQFQYDEEKYNEALDVWYMEQINGRINQQTEAQRQEQAKQDIKRGSEKHYERALEMVNKHKISPQLYQEADRNIRTVLDQVSPGNGDMMTDAILASMGEGSEKVIYTVGRNQNKLSAFRAAMEADPSGIKAMLYLGEQKAEASRVIKRPIKPKKGPVTPIKGEKPVTPTSEGKIKTQYQSEKDPQKKWNLRKAAKAQGFDVGEW